MIIKVCGMRDASNIKDIEELNIDMMGFIFYSKSPRFVDNIPSYLPQRCKRVGVFVDESNDYILKKASEFSLDYIQLHGKESAAQCKLIKENGFGVIKVFSIKGDNNEVNIDICDINSLTKDYAEVCDYFLFDTQCKEYGGSGKKFNWDILSKYTLSTPFLLSGGIGYQNIEEIKEYSHPAFAGIDLNSKFEIEPAFKDKIMLKEFISNIRNK